MRICGAGRATARTRRTPLSGGRTGARLTDTRSRSPRPPGKDVWSAPRPGCIPAVVGRPQPRSPPVMLPRTFRRLSAGALAVAALLAAPSRSPADIVVTVEELDAGGNVVPGGGQ